MRYLKGFLGVPFVTAVVSLVSAGAVFSRSEAFKENIYSVGQLKPIDSKLKVKVGEKPGFYSSLGRGGEGFPASVSGEKERGPVVCSGGLDSGLFGSVARVYITQGLFEEHNAILLGITVDNIPTLIPGPTKWVGLVSGAFRFFPHGA